MACCTLEQLVSSSVVMFCVRVLMSGIIVFSCEIWCRFIPHRIAHGQISLYKRRSHLVNLLSRIVVNEFCYAVLESVLKLFIKAFVRC